MKNLLKKFAAVSLACAGLFLVAGCDDEVTLTTPQQDDIQANILQRRYCLLDEGVAIVTEENGEYVMHLGDVYAMVGARLNSNYADFFLGYQAKFDCDKEVKGTDLKYYDKVKDAPHTKVCEECFPNRELA